MSFALLFWSLSNLILRMNSCVNISCCCCSLLCSHGVDPRVHFHSQSSARAFTSFRFCFVPILSQCKNGPQMRSCRRQHKYVHPTLFWFVSLDISDRSRIWPKWFCDLCVCLPECIVGFVIDPLPFSLSVSSSMRRSLLNHIIRD